MGVSFSNQSLAWATENEGEGLPRASQTIIVCEVTADSGNILGTLRDMNLFTQLQSDSEKFEG
jgi:hypothetical protein